jgi:hypothetical protein
MKAAFLTGPSFLLLLGCQPATPDPAAAPEAPAAAVVGPEPAASARPRYEGTYALTDTTCALSITITRRDTNYFFACDTVRGPVRVWRDDTATGFTFVGLKSIDPEDDNIGCAWQDSMLIIQNYGNAMNEYQRFACGDKYLELRRQ